MATLVSHKTISEQLNIAQNGGTSLVIIKDQS